MQENGRSEAVGWGVIGTSEIAASHMVGAVRAGGGNIVAVLSASEARAADFAHRFSISRHYADINAFLNDRGVEAVYISATADLRTAMALSAMAAGRHVLCERPMALTVNSADAMTAAADSFGTLLVANHALRSTPGTLALRDAVRTGAIGRPVAVRMFNSMPQPRRIYGGGTFFAAGGEGALFDLTIDDADVISFVLGDSPVEVMAHGQSSDLCSPDVDDHVMCFASYRNGTMAQTLDAYTSGTGGVSIEIYGTEGRVFAQDLWGNSTVVLENKHGRVDLRVEGSGELAYVSSVRAFHAAMSSRARPSVSGREATSALSFILAAHRSCRTGRREIVEHD